MDDAIKKLLSSRKADRVKQKIKTHMTAEEVLTVEKEAEEEFLLANWLPNAAKRADQLSLVTHPSKFSHPDAKTSSIIADSKRLPDGFLRTGNVTSELDVFGNAAAMDVYKFLSLKLNDGMTILEHLELRSEKIKTDLSISSASFEELSKDFLAIKIKQADETLKTSDKVKQVYFPLDDGYHLLSLLTSSGVVFELRKRIQEIRFSEHAKIAKQDKRGNTYNELGFDELCNLSMIGYGGTKPQNISVLNSAYGGKAYLLSSIPPLVTKKNEILPKNDFFKDSLWLKEVKEYFLALHKIFKLDPNNISIRDNRDNLIQSVIDYIIEKVWLMRSQKIGWSIEKNLPDYQKIWLDEFHKNSS